MSKIHAGSLKTQCRACLEIAPPLYPLVGHVANCDVNISTMISYCTISEIDLGDDLPSGVCIPCFRTIRIAYNFLRQYKESQEKLLKERNEIKQTQNLEDSKPGKLKWKVERETEDERNAEHEFQDSQSEDETNNDLIWKTENETASEEEQTSGDHEPLELQSEHFLTFNKVHEEDDGRVEYFLEPTEYLEEDSESTENENNKIEHNLEEAEYDENDILVEKLESGLYEVEDSSNDKNYKVRIIRNRNPPGTHESTIFRMKVNTRYLCPICPNVIYRHFERGLMRHMGIHEGETFTCNLCSESQTEYNSDSFLKHYVDIHLFQCQFCQKSFAKRCSLLYHVKTHTNILYSCKYEGCSKVYPSRTALNKHETIHTDAVRHVCSECGMNFKTYDTYKYHMNRHAGNKFLCSICGRTFILSVNLKNHMLAHEGGRPFKCSFCHKTYTSYTPLNKHMRKYHADKKMENGRYYQYNVNT